MATAACYRVVGAQSARVGTQSGVASTLVPVKRSARLAANARRVVAQATPASTTTTAPKGVDLEKLKKALEEEQMHTTQGSHGTNYHHPNPGAGFTFYMPTQSLMGPNSMSSAGAEIKALGLKKALVVTDGVLHKIGATKAIVDVLSAVGVSCVVYDGTEPNPTCGQVEAGLAMLAKEACDFVVSFGGGSPHDCAKAIAIVASNGGTIRDYEGVNKMKKAMMPLVAVNTTAGTGSEMTRFAIITDEKRHVKMAIIDARCTPTLAVDDPMLMLGMPMGLTAATGMDALTHAIEAYVSTISTPVTDACALHAVKLITTHLRKAVYTGSDVEARDMMSYAEFLAGMAFNSASLGYVHAMAHQLGGFYNLPHGVCNAVLLPVVAQFNSKAVPELFIDLARAMGYTDVGEDKDKAVRAVVAGIKQLKADVGIPANLKALGVKTADFGTLADNAMKDACGFTNPIQPTKAQVIQLYQEAYDQE